MCEEKKIESADPASTVRVTQFTIKEELQGNNEKLTRKRREGESHQTTDVKGIPTRKMI